MVLFALGALRLAHHEMWRDELVPWAGARDAASLDALVANLRGYGHPYLWGFLLYAVSRFFPEPEAMQWLHLAIATLAAVLVVARAPFGRVQKLLLVLGYFPFYEYTVVSRGYGLGMLLAWAVCALRRSWRAAALLCLCLMTQTSAYGALVAVALAAGWLVEALAGRRFTRVFTRTGLAVAAVLGSALVVGLVQMLPQRIAFELPHDGAGVAAVLGTVLKGHLPFPRPGLHFWTAYALDGWPWLEAAAALGLITAGVLLLRRSASALTLFLTGQALLLAISGTIGLGFARHHGHALIVTLAALWFAASADPGFLAGFRSRVVTALLVLQIPAALYASVQDLRLPFSQSQAAARALEALHQPTLPVVADRAFSGAAVSAWLRRPFYYPATGRYDTRGFWNAARPDLTPEQVVDEARRLGHASNSDALLVLNYPLPGGVGLVHPVARLEPSIVGNEVFWLYRVPR